MSDPEIPDAPDSDAMRALLKRSLAHDEHDANGGGTGGGGGGGSESERRAPVLLRGVQKRIRQRSKGKFYGDGWSTTQSKVNYTLVAIVMLVLIAVVYFVLGPTGIAPR